MESLYEVRPVVTRTACRNHPFLTTQYGSRSGVWRILRLLEKHKIPCTAYAVGQALEMNPEVGEALKEGGHEFASHGWRWIDRSAWTVEEEEDNVRKTIRGAQRYHRCVRVCVIVRLIRMGSHCEGVRWTAEGMVSQHRGDRGFHTDVGRYYGMVGTKVSNGCFFPTVVHRRR